jgi:predicted metal-dependent hydrolase
MNRSVPDSPLTSDDEDRRGRPPTADASFRASPTWPRPRSRPRLWAQFKDHNRPDFHPDDSDTTELVETWRAELFGDNGTLNDKLIGAAA